MEVQKKSEQYTEEMIEIMETYHKYIASTCNESDELNAVMFRGDQLTVERAQSAERARSQSQTATDRLDGLHPKIEDWHALVNFYQVLIIIKFIIITHILLLFTIIV